MQSIILGIENSWLNWSRNAVISAVSGTGLLAMDPQYTKPAYCFYALGNAFMVTGSLLLLKRLSSISTLSTPRKLFWGVNVSTFCAGYVFSVSLVHTEFSNLNKRRKLTPDRVEQ
eukprot:snap_masked-scaffold_20-processed-gene-1.25-mRNA-1 protein AED:1.00 eAED:1.00 QI:0/-1/0/0/-1/1/1/0/114